MGRVATTNLSVLTFLILSSPVWFTLVSCSNAGLEPLTEPLSYVDDKLSIEGQYCTSPADEVAFPVKILIVIDQSASLQCTDPGNNRLTALNQAGSALDSLPNVQFAVVGFASWSKITDFTTSWAEAREALAPEDGQGGPATDYQGALSEVLRVLERDMVESGPAMAARTKYVVLFLSDGIPEPRCNAGCDDGDEPPDALYGVCNTTQTIPDGYYVDMHTLCPDYNQPAQLAQKASDIMSLAEVYGVGDLTISTIFLFAPEEEIIAVCGDISQFGYDKDQAEPLLRSMAEEGLGTFRDVNISTELDFLEFNYESLMAPYKSAEFFAINLNALPLAVGLGIDSDRDGVPDEVEFEYGMSRLSGDSDGDRFGDLIEHRYAAQGFDALDPAVPAIGCTSTADRDGDGLLECEEMFLLTNPLLADTDGDRIPDNIEVRLGLDPTVHDTAVDHDFDGKLSGFEVRAGTNPVVSDEKNTLLNPIRYRVEEVTQGPVQLDDITCYDFFVQDMTLVPTLNIPDEAKGKGFNRILIFAEEEPVSLAGSRGRFHVACIEARYLGDTFKDPPSGRIDNLTPLRFVDLAEFDPLVHCLEVGGDPSDIPDGGVF